MASNTASTTRTTPAKMTSGPLATSGDQKQPVDDFVAYWKDYAKEKPEVCALWCLGIGFVIGWKLKPW